MKLPKYQQVAEMVCGQIADGVLTPSGAALARVTGYSALTCRRALRTLVKDGVLAPGPSRNARPRVPGSARNDQTVADAKRELSAALAGRRRGAGLTQPQLAEITGDLVTTIGHAETGRLWQSRPFWERADKALNANGDLLRLHDTYRAVDVSTDPATVATETVLSTPDSGEAQSPVEGPPTPAIILIVWTDGAITAAPMTRETR